MSIYVGALNLIASIPGPSILTFSGCALNVRILNLGLQNQIRKLRSQKVYHLKSTLHLKSFQQDVKGLEMVVLNDKMI